MVTGARLRNRHPRDCCSMPGRGSRPALESTKHHVQRVPRTLLPGVELYLRFPYASILCTGTTSMLFNCSQRPGDRQPLRDVTQWPAAEPMWPTHNPHSVQCLLRSQLDRPCLRDQPRHHPHSKSRRWLLVRTCRLAHTGQSFGALPSVVHSITHSPHDTGVTIHNTVTSYQCRFALEVS